MVGRALRGTARELPRSLDLAALAGLARDLGYEVTLVERPMPDAVSVLGIGCIAELTGESVAAVAKSWDELRAGAAIDGDPQLPGTGLVALGGFAFQPDVAPGGAWEGFPGLLLRVPALAITRVRGRTFACVLDPVAEEVLAAVPPPPAAPAARTVEVESVLPVERWLDIVATAIERLRAGEAEKVVLAREVIARADGVVTAGAVTGALRAAYPSCFTYLVTGADGTAFVGATPELLVRRSGVHAVAQPMAGSTARGGDDEEDRRLAAALLASAKDQGEHRVAAREVRAALAGLATTVEAGEPEVIAFTNIQHLATTIRAKLEPSAPASALELAAALHPTPAIAGHPRAAALRLIAELEDMERGWYGGAVGWTDARGDGEFALALRCGLLWEDGARLYAGVGVMPDSDPAAELRETELKLRPLLGALAG